MADSEFGSECASDMNVSIQTSACVCTEGRIFADGQGRPMRNRVPRGLQGPDALPVAAG
jgi:hypothetical protein